MSDDLTTHGEWLARAKARADQTNHRRLMPADPRLYDPDPDVRLQAWRELATNAGITADTVDRLARSGFTEAAHGLAAATGAPTDNRGKFLGRIQAWGLDVYETSPEPWKQALEAEHEGDHHAH